MIWTHETNDNHTTAAATGNNVEHQKHHLKFPHSNATRKSNRLLSCLVGSDDSNSDSPNDEDINMQETTNANIPQEIHDIATAATTANGSDVPQMTSATEVGVTNSNVKKVDRSRRLMVVDADVDHQQHVCNIDNSVRKVTGGNGGGFNIRCSNTYKLRCGRAKTRKISVMDTMHRHTL